MRLTGNLAGWAISLSACIICYTLCIPFTIYASIVFRRLSESDLYKKRFPKVVHYLTTLSILSFMLEKPATFVTSTSPLNYTNPHLHTILCRISSVLYCILSHGYLYLMLHRYWLLFYSLHLDKCIANSKWKRHLNPHNDAQDFWMVHRKYGSEIRSFRFFFVFYLIHTMACICIHQTYLTEHVYIRIVFLMDLIMYLIPTLFTLIMWHKLPRCMDHYLIRKELHMILMVLLCGCVTQIICLCLSTWHSFASVLMLIRATLSLFLLFTLHQVCTLWIANKYNKIQFTKLVPIYSHSTFSTKSSSESTPTGRMRNDRVRVNAPHSKLISLPMILSDTECFELFALYLIDEFCLEIILCFVELLEFKKAFKSKYLLYLNGDNSFYSHGFDVEYMNEYIDVHVGGCSSFIVSSNVKRITHEKNDTQQFVHVFHHIIYLLYYKYIKTNGEFAVTLSDEYMVELEQYVNDEIVNKKGDSDHDTVYLMGIYQYFDDMLSELYLCLDSPHQRFVRSERFRESIANIFSSKNACCCS
eukprot:86147_1